ncbi:MAG: ExbD/TolR family protein [Maritimibacter sp.]
MPDMSLGKPRQSRRPSLTPMIDVVFLLLVFFMLASKFGSEGAIKVAGANGPQTTAYSGPPRLVDIGPNGVLLNGSDIPEATLVKQLAGLMSAPTETVVLRAREGADVQRVVTVMETLTRAGLSGLILIEAADQGGESK